MIDMKDSVHSQAMNQNSRYATPRAVAVYPLDNFSFTNYSQQAVSTGADHLVFGYGVQACPGRFFALHEAKVVVARILRSYDFKLKKRPVQMSVSAGLDGILNKVDPTVEFVFKRHQPDASPK
jgi:cytochrome P450